MSPVQYCICSYSRTVIPVPGQHLWTLQGFFVIRPFRKSKSLSQSWKLDTSPSPMSQSADAQLYRKGTGVHTCTVLYMFSQGVKKPWFSLYSLCSLYNCKLNWNCTLHACPFQSTAVFSVCFWWPQKVYPRFMSFPVSVYCTGTVCEIGEISFLAVSMAFYYYYYYYYYYSVWDCPTKLYSCILMLCFDFCLHMCILFL